MNIDEFNTAHAGQRVKAGIIKHKAEWNFAFLDDVYIPYTMAKSVRDGDEAVVEYREVPDGRFSATSVSSFDDYCHREETAGREEFIPPRIPKTAPVMEYVSGSSDERVLKAHVTGLKRKLMAREWAGAKGVVVGIEYHVTVTSPAKDAVDSTIRKVEVSGVSSPTLEVDASEWTLVISRSVNLHDLLEDDGAVTDWELHEERLRGVAEAVLAEMMAK